MDRRSFLKGSLVGAGWVVGINTLGDSAAGAETPIQAATHQEKECIGTTKETQFGALSSFCLNSDGNLLCCDAKASQIKVITPVGKVLDTWKMPFAVWRIRRADDGSVYVGGTGVLARLDSKGKIIKKVASDGSNFPKAKVSGIAVTNDYVFASLGSGWSLRSKAVIVRFDRNLGKPKTIAQDLRGCCQRLDLAAKDDAVYVAENARFRVVRYDAEGKVLSSWGEKSRTSVEGFGACCNPMNIIFGPGGELYTAESGLGRVKRYSPDGKFLGLVGQIGVLRFTRAGRTASSCSNITVAVTKDAKRVFVQDVSRNIIRVLLKEGVPVEGAKAAGATTAENRGPGVSPSHRAPGPRRRPTAR